MLSVLEINNKNLVHSFPSKLQRRPGLISPLAPLRLRCLPDDRGEQNAGAVGQGGDGRLGQHDPRQHSPAKAEQHGAEPAGQGADSGDLKSTCTWTEVYV